MKAAKFILFFAITFFLAGCARQSYQANVDPWEGYNRVIYAFNTDLDHLILRPIATVYNTITPPPLQKGITNIFANVNEVTIIPNDLLQGKVKYALSDFMRLVINTVFGIGGLFDVASRLGLPKHYEDFGMTLAYWGGGKPSQYFMLPFFGPDTFRDGVLGRSVDYLASPWPWIRHQGINWGVHAVKFVNTRSSFLPADKLVAQSFDPYIFVRNAYLQRRMQLLAQNEVNKQPTDAFKMKQGIRTSDQTFPPKPYGTEINAGNPDQGTKPVDTSKVPSNKAKKVHRKTLSANQPTRETKERAGAKQVSTKRHATSRGQLSKQETVDQSAHNKNKGERQEVPGFAIRYK